MKRPSLNTQQLHLKHPHPSSTKNSTKAQKSSEKSQPKLQLQLKDLTIIQEKQRKHTPKMGRNNSKIGDTPSHKNFNQNTSSQNSFFYPSNNIKQNLFQAKLEAENLKSLTDTEDYQNGKDIPITNRQVLKLLGRRRIQSSSSSRQPSASVISSDHKKSKIGGIGGGLGIASAVMLEKYSFSNSNNSSFPISVKNNLDKSNITQNLNDTQTCISLSKAQLKPRRNKSKAALTQDDPKASKKQQTQLQQEYKLMQKQLIHSQGQLIKTQVKYEKIKKIKKQMEKELEAQRLQINQNPNELYPLLAALKTQVYDVMENNHFLSQKRFIKQLQITLDGIYEQLGAAQSSGHTTATEDHRMLQIPSFTQLNLQQNNTLQSQENQRFRINSNRLPSGQTQSQTQFLKINMNSQQQQQYEAQINELSNQNEEMQQKISQLEQQIQQQKDNEKNQIAHIRQASNYSQQSDDVTQTLQKYAAIVTKVHQKLKEIGVKLEEVEQGKRRKIREVRKKMEQELNIMKERNQILFVQSKDLEEQLDKSLSKVEELNEELAILNQDKDIITKQIDKLQEINERQENFIALLQQQIRQGNESSSSGNAPLMGLDRSYCASSVLSQNQMWNNGLGSALGNPQWNEGAPIQDISELTSKSQIDERSSSIGADIKIIQISQSPNISINQHNGMNNQHYAQPYKSKSKRRQQNQPSSQLSNYNNSNGGMGSGTVNSFNPRKQSLYHHAHNASNFYNCQHDFAGTSIVSVINPILAEEQASEFSNSEEKRLFYKRRNSSSVAQQWQAQQRRTSSGMSGVNVSNYLQYQKNETMSYNQNPSSNAIQNSRNQNQQAVQSATTQQPKGSLIRQHIDSSSKMSRNEANGHQARTSSKTMTFAERSKGPRIVGHLEDIVEDYQRHEEELTLRENQNFQNQATHFQFIQNSKDQNIHMSQLQQSLNNNGGGVSKRKGQSIQYHQKKRRMSSQERSYSESPTLLSNSNIMSTTSAVNKVERNIQVPFRSKTSTPCQKIKSMIEIQSNQFELLNDYLQDQRLPIDQDNSNVSAKKLKTQSHHVHNCNRKQYKEMHQYHQFEDRLTQSDANFKDYITQDIDQSMMMKGSDTQMNQMNKMKKQQDKENTMIDGTVYTRATDENGVHNSGFTPQQMNRAQHQSMIFQNPKGHDTFMRRMSNIEISPRQQDNGDKENQHNYWSTNILSGGRNIENETYEQTQKCPEVFQLTSRRDMTLNNIKNEISSLDQEIIELQHNLDKAIKFENIQSSLYDQQQLLLQQQYLHQQLPQKLIRDQ
ncbi:UNKNOWN [Stylonychia lemnae]|uniref:Uncharacterized protein n=1 Tax=Stylonychia lemnae TaxID=5949 RepID=A0A078A3K1_STYLE|nr:UNKNOWN [Stylonychia lemnae]|eukprot:CDW76757.1 UNKNOWN [Stylonychia lemnae]